MVLRFLCLLLVSISLSSTATANKPSPSRSAYIHLPQCFDGNAPISAREQSLRGCLDRIQSLGLTTVVPYVSTTSGEAHYPSRFLKSHRWGDWDPVQFFVQEARQRNLKVMVCTPVLACGHKTPAGILKQHPEWALRREEDGKPVGSISPGHPDARAWVTDWLSEVVTRYEPDGILLDYLRYSSLATQLDEVSAAGFSDWKGSPEVTDETKRMRKYREHLLTELAGQISERLRSLKPGLQIAIYSWGHHVTSNHRVGQAWPVWAARGYIDEVNVCGYWYPKTYPKRWGANHMDAFRTVMNGCRKHLDDAGASTRLTFALGVRTSHGQVKTVVDIASYLNAATDIQMDGVTFFTWSYLEPFLPQMQQWDVMSYYADGQPIPDLTTSNIHQGQQRDQTPVAATEANPRAAGSPSATLLVAAADSSAAKQAAADFVCRGTSDQEQINQAIAALPIAGGTVQLAAGTYDIRRGTNPLGGIMIRRSNVVLAGEGSSSKLVLAADQNTNVIRILGSGIHHVTIRDLLVDANRDENPDGQGDPEISHARFEFCGIKAYARDPRGPGAEDVHDITVRDCEVRDALRLGIMLEGRNIRVLDNVLGNAGSDVVELLTGPGMIRGNHFEITGQTHVAIGSDRANSIIMSDNVVHVRPGGKLDIAIRTWSDSQRHVVSNNVVVVDEQAQCSMAMDLRGQMQSVSSNTVESLNSEQPGLVRIGGGNTVLTGNTFRNAVIEVNDTYDGELPVVLQANILDNTEVRHVTGNLIR